MKRLVRGALFCAGMLVALAGCGKEEAAPECIEGVVLTRQGCPEATLIQVLNKPGIGRTVVFGNSYNAASEYENVVKTSYLFEEDISVLRGKTIYFRYTQPDHRPLMGSDAQSPCQAVYLNYDVPEVELQGYSLTNCVVN